MGRSHVSGPFKSTGGYEVGAVGTNTEVIDSDGIFTIGTSKVAVVTAAPSSTTLTAAQTGSVVAVSATGANTITLPTAAAGLQYRLVVSASGAAATVTPGSGDKLVVYDATGGSILTATNAGDLSITAATPNSGAGLTLTAINTSTWVANGAVGGWTTT